jgi:hypothetical protein
VTDDEGVNEEFNELIERMSDPSAVQQVEICEVAESANMVEVLVPVTVYPHPEIVLFEAVIAYLKKGPRRAVLGMSMVYEIRSHNLPHLIGTLFLSEPVRGE